MRTGPGPESANVMDDQHRHSAMVTVRNEGGKGEAIAGATMASLAPLACIAASTSAPTLPRNVESIFLYTSGGLSRSQNQGATTAPTFSAA